MNNKLEVIGIDHGWSMMKTVTQVFVTGALIRSISLSLCSMLSLNLAIVLLALLSSSC